MRHPYYKLFYIFVVQYLHWLFLVIIIFYSIFFPEYMYIDTINVFASAHYNYNIYLPNYLQFNQFFNINDFLMGTNNLICYDTIDDQILELENSLQEIDYPIFGDGQGKPIKYIQSHQLPRWSAEDEISWTKTHNTILQTGYGNWTYDFERGFLKYCMGDPGFKDYMPLKYTSWRYCESLYMKFLVYEIKDLSMRMEGWKILRVYAGNRLSSKRKCSYLFRCYDTYLRLYFRYEFVQCEHWAYVFNKRVRWMIKEYYWRKPWIIGTWWLIKGLIGGFCIYKGWVYWS